MRKFLIVDDDESIRNLITATLKIFTVKFICTDNGSDAVTLAGKYKPEIVIMDIIMPGKVDGLQALRKIISNEGTKDCKVILLTSKKENRDINLGINSGASGYLIKPFHPVELINLVESLL